MVSAFAQCLRNMAEENRADGASEVAHAVVQAATGAAVAMGAAASATTEPGDPLSGGTSGANTAKLMVAAVEAYLADATVWVAGLVTARGATSEERQEGVGAVFALCMLGDSTRELFVIHGVISALAERLQWRELSAVAREQTLCATWAVCARRTASSTTTPTKVC